MKENVDMTDVIQTLNFDMTCSVFFVLLMEQKRTANVWLKMVSPASSKRPSWKHILQPVIVFSQLDARCAYLTLEALRGRGGGGSNWHPLDSFGFKFLLLDRLSNGQI